MKLLILSMSTLLFISNIHANSIQCRQKGNGYAVYNNSNKIFLGSGHYTTIESCLLALRSENGGLVCASKPPGTAIYDIISGEIIGNKSGYYTSLKFCSKALKFQNKGVVCAPKISGSGVYDLRKNRFLGKGYYLSINLCVWASNSATEDEACVPYDEGSAIYNRDLNKVSVPETYFSSVRDCAKSL